MIQIYPYYSQIGSGEIIVKQLDDYAMTTWGSRSRCSDFAERLQVWYCMLISSSMIFFWRIHNMLKQVSSMKRYAKTSGIYNISNYTNKLFF